MASKVVKAEEQKLKDANEYGRASLMKMYADMEAYCKSNGLGHPQLAAGGVIPNEDQKSRSVMLQGISGDEMITFAAGILKQLVDSGADQTIMMLDVASRIKNLSNG